MSTIFTMLVSNPTLIAILAGIIGAMGWGFHQRQAGAAKERAKQAQSEAKARSVADEIDDAVAGRSPDANRDELKKWSAR